MRSIVTIEEIVLIIGIDEWHIGQCIAGEHQRGAKTYKQKYPDEETGRHR